MKLLAIALLSVLAISADAKQLKKVSINPVVVDFDSLPRLSTSKIFAVGTVENSVFTIDTTPIGETRTGLKRYAPIICNPNPAVVMKKSMQDVLTKQGRYAEDPSTAAYVIEMRITSFDLKESSHKITQTLQSTIKVEVVLTNPLDISQTKKFIIHSEGSRTALDTTKFAEQVMRDAITSAVKELLKSIDTI